MQIRYKLLFFLIYKLKLKLFKKFESNFKKRIILDAHINHSPRFDVRFKHLVFDINKRNTSFCAKSRIVFYILYVRALTRTLIFATQVMPNSNEIYEMSRLEMGMELLKNRRLILKNLVSHLSYIYLNFEEFSNLKSLTPIHIGSKYFAEDLKYHQAYVIEKSYGERNYLKFNNNDKIRQTTLDKFIDWNSIYFKKFIKFNKLEGTVNNYLQENYPLLHIEINRYAEVEYVNHELSNFSFDDLIQKRGFNSFETIPNCEIWHQRFICVENKIINFDATTFPTQKFVAGNWQFSTGDRKNLGSQLILKPSKISVNIGKAIYLIGRCDENWYHFLLDTAPRLLFFENIPTNVPILVRSDLPSTTKEFLRKFTERNVIEVEPNQTMIVSLLYVCPGRSTVFDSNPPKGLNWVQYSPVVLNIFRRKVLDSLGVSSDEQAESNITFVRNSSTRNTLNWKSVHRVLQDFGFQTLLFNEKFYRRQVKVFHDAKFVVASGGAVLANIIFMKPGSKVLVLRSWRGGKIKLWKDLSKSLNLEYFETKGFPTYWGFSFLRSLHSDYLISPRKLRRILSKEI